eukprot:424518_1
MMNAMIMQYVNDELKNSEMCDAKYGRPNTVSRAWDNALCLLQNLNDEKIQITYQVFGDKACAQGYHSHKIQPSGKIHYKIFTRLGGNNSEWVSYQRSYGINEAEINIMKKSSDLALWWDHYAKNALKVNYKKYNSSSSSSSGSGSRKRKMDHQLKVDHTMMPSNENAPRPSFKKRKVQQSSLSQPLPDRKSDFSSYSPSPHPLFLGKKSMSSLTQGRESRGPSRFVAPQYPRHNNDFTFVPYSPSSNCYAGSDREEARMMGTAIYNSMKQPSYRVYNIGSNRMNHNNGFDPRPDDYYKSELFSNESPHSNSEVFSNESHFTPLELRSNDLLSNKSPLYSDDSSPSTVTPSKVSAMHYDSSPPQVTAVTPFQPVKPKQLAFKGTTIHQKKKRGPRKGCQQRGGRPKTEAFGGLKNTLIKIKSANVDSDDLVNLIKKQACMAAASVCTFLGVNVTRPKMKLLIADWKVKNCPALTGSQYLYGAYNSVTTSMSEDAVKIVRTVFDNKKDAAAVACLKRMKETLGICIVEDEEDDTKGNSSSRLLLPGLNDEHRDYDQ